MENFNTLATESFSYGWLTDTKPPSFDSLPNNNLISIFPQTCGEKEQSFNFDISVTTSPSAFVHAEELFSDGHIMPVYVKRSKMEASRTSASVPSSPFTSYSTRSQFFDGENKSQLGKWTKSSKRTLRKWFGFVRPLCKTIGGSMTSSRVDDLERKVCEVQSFSSSSLASPRRITSYSVVEWANVQKTSKKSDVFKLKRVRRWSSCSSQQASPRICPSPSRDTNPWSCDAESSVHEAILYCKRSIEK